jgi:hypothetical protein
MPWVREWIYVESLPLSEGDGKNIWFADLPDEVYTDIRARMTYFIARFQEKFLLYDFHLKEHLAEENLLVFRKQDKKNRKTSTTHIYFFYNTIFPEDASPRLITMLSRTNAIYFSGFIPDKRVLSFMKYPLYFLVSDNVSIEFGCKRKDPTVFDFVNNNYVKDILYVYISCTKDVYGDKAAVMRRVRKTRFFSVSNLLEAHYIMIDRPHAKKEIKRNFLIGDTNIYNDADLLEVYLDEPKVFPSGSLLKRSRRRPILF